MFSSGTKRRCLVVPITNHTPGALVRESDGANGMLIRPFCVRVLRAAVCIDHLFAPAYSAEWRSIYIRPWVREEGRAKV